MNETMGNLRIVGVHVQLQVSCIVGGPVLLVGDVAASGCELSP